MIILENKICAEPLTKITAQNKVTEKIANYVGKLERKEGLSIQEVEDFTLSIVFDILDFKRAQDLNMPPWFVQDIKVGKAITFEYALHVLVPHKEQPFSEGFINTIHKIYENKNVYANKDLLTLITNILFTLTLYAKQDNFRLDIAEFYYNFMDKQSVSVKEQYSKTISTAKRYIEIILEKKNRSNNLSQESKDPLNQLLNKVAIENGMKTLDNCINLGEDAIKSLGKMFVLTKHDLYLLMR